MDADERSRDGIIGREQEWALHVERHGIADEALMNHMGERQVWLEQCAPPGLFSSWLEYIDKKRWFSPLTGDRFYFDSSTHFENSTRECAGPVAAALYSRVADRIVEEIVARANKTYQDRGYTFRLYKNNCDFLDNSYGTHENYLVERLDLTRTDMDMVRVLGPFLVTRQLFAGSGGVVRKNDYTMGFVLSPRARFINILISGGSSAGSRPLITTRDQPYADKHRWQRLHFALGDGLLVDAAEILTFGTTEILLRMREAGLLNDPPVPVEAGDLIPMLQVYNSDPSLKVAIRCADGKTYTIADIQEAYRDCARKACESTIPLTPQRATVFELWDRVLEGARASCPYETLRLDIQWAAMYWLVERDMERHGHRWNASSHFKVPSLNMTVSERLRALDLGCHENHPAGHIRRMIERGYIRSMFTQEDIARARAEPFADTRAYARVKQLRWAAELAERRGSPVTVQVDWEYTKIDPIDVEVEETYRLVSEEGIVEERVKRTTKHAWRYEFDNSDPYAHEYKPPEEFRQSEGA